VFSQNYSLVHAAGLRQFKRLMEILDVHPAADGTIDLQRVVGLVLTITVAHRKSNGKSFANVVDVAQ